MQPDRHHFLNMVSCLQMLVLIGSFQILYTGFDNLAGMIPSLCVFTLDLLCDIASQNFDGIID